MTEDQTSNLDMWGDLEPVVMEEQEAPDFSKPIKGRYEADIEGVEYKEIHSDKTDQDYELIDVAIKICADIDGDKSFNRKLNKAYFMGVSKFSDDPIAGYKIYSCHFMSKSKYSGLMALYFCANCSI